MDIARKMESYTIEDIYILPDGERAELIDGKIYYITLPSTKHQRLLNYINTEINIYIREKNGEWEVFPVPFAVFLNKDNTIYVERIYLLFVTKIRLQTRDVMVHLIG